MEDLADLILAKLRPPEPTGDAVPRIALVTRLDEAFKAGARVFALVAPAGYGKTTLLGQWLPTTEARVAWLSLEPSENDPRSFLRHLVGALALAGVSIDQRVVRGTPSGEPAGLLPTITNAIEACGGPLVIVLDDYHVIEEGAVHATVERLIRHLPRPARLVLASRQDPQLRLARLRAASVLVEVRARDLRMSEQEVAAVLGPGMTAHADPRAVHDRTEGWPVAVRLAAIASSRPGSEAGAHMFPDADGFVLEYLFDEVLGGMPAGDRRFLTLTAVTDRTCGPLAARLTGDADAEGVLQRLLREGLPLERLEGGWFRYHALLREALLAELPADVRQHSAARAARWFAEHGQPDRAVGLAVEAGDVDSAAGWLDEAAEDLFARGQYAILAGAVARLPRTLRARHPRSVVLGAWATFLTGDARAADALLEDVAAAAPQRDRWRADALQAYLANRRGLPEAPVLARQALERIGEDEMLIRPLALGTLGEALVADDTLGALQALEAAHDSALTSGQHGLAVEVAYGLAILEVILGRRLRALERAEHSRQRWRTSAGSLLPPGGLALLALGIARYEGDERGDALLSLRQGHRLVEQAGLRAFSAGIGDVAEISLLHGEGEREAAARGLRRVLDDAARHGYARLRVGMLVLAARLAMVEGDVERARALVEDVPVERSALNLTTVPPGVVHAQLWVALGDAPRAIGVLLPVVERERRAGRDARLIRALAQLAVAYAHASADHEAQHSLREAIGLAAPEGYRRAFVELPETGPLLRRARPVAPAFVDDVLGRLPAGPRVAPSASMLDPLTDREQEVLRLLAAGLSNDEIGRALGIGAGTAKWHVHHVLEKLGVPRRTAAVRAGRELGLLG
jgi:LuxR family transcriptional regulator, maltose regulon positive regulatory protein